MASLRETLSKKTDNQLIYYVENPGKHTEEAVQLALEELQNRQVSLPENKVKMIAEKLAVIRFKRNPLSKKEKDEIFYQTLVFSLLYVGIGTLAILSLSPGAFFYGDWAISAILITFPVTIISFGIAYADGDATFLILFIQVIHFFICWVIVFNVLISIRERQKREANSNSV